MAEIVYALCAATSFLCFWLLTRAYRATRAPLLLWSSVAFFCFTVGNFLLFVDMILLPQVDLMLYRTLINLLGVALLLRRLICDAVKQRP
jgi:hypothetical protein